ncbi:MAG: 30S ribosomal protein S1 [Candidatus Promineifilaceae bacterium]
MSDQINDFASELENFLDFETPQMGDIRTGIVVSISQQGAIVALSNLKRDGIVPNSDLNKLEPGEREKLQVNDEVAIRIINTNDPDSLIVSIYQARIVEDWDNAEKLKESTELIEVEISGYNKGGLIAPFGRLRGFIPLSQVTGFSRNMNDRDRQRKMAKMRGTSIPVKVIEVDRQRRRLVFSQREGQREWDAARKEAFLKTVSVGDKLKGTVRSIRDFGVFVDLGEADGLVHVSELEWYRVRHPREVVKVGDEIEVQVLKVDTNTQKISLSRKPLIENPWDRIHEKYGESDLVEGVIVRITDYGAFVELEPGVEGLLHITQLSRANVESTEEIVQEGERHLLRVLTVDSDRQRIRLSLKAVSATEQIQWMTRKNQPPAEEAPEAEATEEAPAPAAEAATEEAPAAEAATEEAPAPEADAASEE